MRKLLSANFSRLLKSRLFWSGIAVTMAYTAFLLVMNYREGLSHPGREIAHLNWYFLSQLNVVGLICPVLAASFLGTEYLDGTIRNKLTVGHRRGTVYFANLITLLSAALLMFLAGCAVVLAAGVPMFGWNIAYPERFVWYLLGGVLMLSSLVSLFTALAMWITHKAAAMAVCTVLYMLMYLLGNFSRILALENPQMVQNGAFLRILTFLYDFLPTGQMLQLSSGIVFHPRLLTVYSLAGIAVTCFSGAVLFARKNIR